MAANRRTIVYGFHAVTARVRQAPASVRLLYIDRNRDDVRVRDLLQLALRQSVDANRVDGSRIDRMAPGRRHQGVIAEVEAEVAQALPLPQRIATLRDQGIDPLLLLLDGVTDPRNLGACLRVADAVGVHAVVAPKDHSCQLTDVAIHVASGAAETVPYLLVTNLARTIEDLQIDGLRVIGAADAAPTSLFDAEAGALLTGPLAWALGAEDKGLRRLVRESCDALVSIPMRGRVESLNVSVAAGVVLYESLRRRSALLPGRTSQGAMGAASDQSPRPAARASASAAR